MEAHLAGRPLIAGIDLGSRTHAVWLTGRDLDPKAHFTVAHSLDGIANLVDRADQIQRAGGFDRLLVFMETTGHFWMNVADALEQRGISYRTVSPLAVDRKREIEHLTFAKGDFRDAELIARLGVEGHWLERVLGRESRWIELAALAREHEALLRLEVKERQRRRSLLELALPEFLAVFKDPCKRTASALLRRLCSPAVSTIEEVVERASSLKRQRGLHLKKSTALADLVLSGPSYGVARMLRASFLRLHGSIDRFDLVSEQRTRVRDQLLALYRETPYARRLDTIPGVEPASHALVLGFVGDPRPYERSTCLAKLAGIEPRENHSGLGEGSHSISRRGIPQLRHILFRVVTGLLNGNDEFTAYFERLGSRASNPHAYQQAHVAAANKYLRVFHHLCTHDEDYDPKRLAHRDSSTPKPPTA